MSGSSEGAEPNDEPPLAQVRPTAHFWSKAKLARGAKNFLLRRGNKWDRRTFCAVARGVLLQVGIGVDMAARGAFAVRCHTIAQSLDKDFGGRFIPALNIIKSRDFPHRVNSAESGLGPAVQLLGAYGECLHPVRDKAGLNGKRLARHRVMVEIGDRVAHLPRSFPMGLI